MLERVEIKCINEETSWITEVPSVISLTATLNYTFLRGCEIFFQAMLCLVGGNFIYINIWKYLKIGGIFLYHPKENKTKVLNIVYILKRCPIFSITIPQKSWGIMKLLSLYLGIYSRYETLGFFLIRGYQVWPVYHLINRDIKFNNS